MQIKSSRRRWSTLCGRGVVMIWALNSLLAAAQESSGEVADDPAIEETARESDTASCTEPNIEWPPQGQWTGKYRLVGDNINVTYTMGTNGKMDMQLHLSPRAENLYKIADVQWQKQEVVFSKASDTHCTLSRTTLDDDFEGTCIDDAGEVWVEFISMRAPFVGQAGCDD